MRISDWSSDVCSSDLLEEGAMLVVAPWLTQRNEDNWACPHSFDPARFDDPANAEMVRQAWFPFGRSEEHTSELQSLMRTSYAVFCLKKKHHITNKLNNNPITTHQ